MQNDKEIKLTQFSPGAGWACKLSASDLTQVLSKLSSFNNGTKSEGYESFDDCSIYKLNDKQSIIQSVDFFTPIVDDPYLFGQIAATNSLSDIYAMGGNPLFALNIVGFPSDKIPLDILSSILQGGIDKCNEAKIPILGGHSIKDDVPKYGLAVTGIIDNNKILRNNTAKKSDGIILTKPIGSGILTTAIKKNLTNDSINDEVIKVMNTLNNKTCNILKKYQINACTDITGYGLLGHLNEMCIGSNISAKINFNNVPLISNTMKFAKDNIIPGGTKNNLKFIENNILFSDNIEIYKKLILADAQTSGGLLISCSKKDTNALLKELNLNSEFNSAIIGEFMQKENFNIIINNE